MLKLFADLLMAGEIKIERGSLTVLHQQLVMIPLNFFIELTKHVVDDSQKSVELYELCKRAIVSGFVFKLSGKYQMSGRKLIDWIKNFAEIGGWGQIEIVDYDETNLRAIVRITNTPVGSAMANKVSKPVDHVFRGFMAGAASGAYQKDIDYIETKCVAKGDPYCEFIAKEKSEFLKEGSILVHEQISTTPVIFDTQGTHSEK